ncbi:SAM-dependent methyltransferase, partial [Shigella flexneri]|nr:SAM-dependent methyltransferase [Shigella flexneri]EFW4431606.1 SAM-dependent methyltransferase [Shigella sonnei]EFW9254419.1 SAM-dependent methyltransferase [Shigella boydii]EFW3434604.1 SAM-dependent methyltransferase [Shigella flexneri]EFW4132332.1 SAM-dependent methyltransferase [Shigella flexneri]
FREKIASNRSTFLLKTCYGFLYDLGLRLYLY